MSAPGIGGIDVFHCISRSKRVVVRAASSIRDFFYHCPESTILFWMGPDLQAVDNLLLFSPLASFPGPWYTGISSHYLLLCDLAGLRTKTIHDLHLN